MLDLLILSPATHALAMLGWFLIGRWSKRWHIKQLRETADAAIAEREDEMQRAERIARRVVDVVRALGFYGGDSTWRPHRPKRHSLAYRDRGEVARVAIAGGPVQPVIDRLLAAAEADAVADMERAKVAAESKEIAAAEVKKIEDALAGVEP